MNLATAAAFTAAGVALIVGVFSVAWGSRLSSRAQLEQWRRNEERPIVARMLTLSADAQDQWGTAQSAKQLFFDALKADPHLGPEVTKAQEVAAGEWQAGQKLCNKLRFEKAQLDLIAGRPVRDAANKLVLKHESVRIWLKSLHGGQEDKGPGLSIPA